MSDVVHAIRPFSREWLAARAVWKTSDPRLYAVTPPEPVERLIEEMPTPFGALVRAVLHQQVSISAGRAIISRLVAACGGLVEPQRFLRLSELELREVGLSGRKILYVHALAEAAAGGALEGIEGQTEEAIAEQLVRLPGVGVWTTKMFCIFHLQRPDVFSGGDLGLREGVRILDGRAEPLTPADAERRAEAWRPYRSVAAVVLWDLVRRTRAAARSRR